MEGEEEEEWDEVQIEGNVEAFRAEEVLTKEVDSEEEGHLREEEMEEGDHFRGEELEEED